MPHSKTGFSFLFPPLGNMAAPTRHPNNAASAAGTGVPGTPDPEPGHGTPGHPALLRPNPGQGTGTNQLKVPRPRLLGLGGCPPRHEGFAVCRDELRPRCPGSAAACAHT